jgi:hypothetical protein
MDKQNPEPEDDEQTGPSIERQQRAEQTDAHDDSAYHDPLGGLPIA